jgi:hypothetical protein
VWKNIDSKKGERGARAKNMPSLFAIIRDGFSLCKEEACVVSSVSCSVATENSDLSGKK